MKLSRFEVAFFDINLIKVIEEIIKKLESKDTGLEDMFKLYEEGMKRVNDTYKKIEKIEKDMQIIAGEEE